MTDTNTKKRKKMIKEMKKKTPGYKYYDESNAQKLIHPSCRAEDIMQFKTGGKCRLRVDKNDNWHLPAKELNFLEALLILIIVFILFTVIFPLIQRAVDIQALQTCEAYGDCSDVIRDINK